MSSMFEGPSQPSRIFAAPPERRLFWPKVIGAFAAGVVVTVLISKVPGDSPPVPPPVQSSKLSRVEAAKQREEASKAAQERKAAARTEASNNDARPGELAGAVPPVTPRPGDSSTAPQSDSTASAPGPASPNTNDIAKQADELNCAQQTWPYVDRKCADANGNANQTTRPVRVIPSDRSAPSSVVTTAPSDATVPMPQPAPRVTEGAGNVAPAPRHAERPPATTPAAPAATAPVAEAPRDANRKATESPIRPAVNTAPSPSRETVGSTVGSAATTNPPESARETPPVPRNTSDRRERRDASRRERLKNAASETRRSVRNRAVEDAEDEDMVGREHRLPDGRRVIIQRRPGDDDEASGRRIIQRRTVDRDEDSGRRVIIQRRTAERDDAVVERAPGLRMPPFFINPFGGNN